MDKDGEDIKVNRRKGDKVYFESTLLQQISDGIDFIRDESREILQEIDLTGFDEEDIDEIGEKTFNHISDVADEISQLKAEFINDEDFPEYIRESSRNIKAALNRDDDYIRRAQRRLDRADSDEFVDKIRVNARVIELCDKAIDVNPANSEAYYLKGRALVNLDNYSEAIEEYINALAIEDNVKIWIAIGNANALNGDYEDAIDVYDAVLKSDENSFDAIKGKALTYYSQGDYKKADIEFRKASKIGCLNTSSKEIWDECLENL